MIDAIKWVLENGKEILAVVAHICFIATIIVKLTPTQKDDAMILPIIKFIGKWLALDKYGPAERPK